MKNIGEELRHFFFEDRSLFDCLFQAVFHSKAVNTTHLRVKIKRILSVCILLVRDIPKELGLPFYQVNTPLF